MGNLLQPTLFSLVFRGGIQYSIGATLIKSGGTAMKSYLEMSAAERREELAAQQALYEQEKRAGLNLDMSRGKPDATQLNLSMDMLQLNPYDLM